MNVSAFRQEGYQLMHDGLVELSRIESNGVRINVEMLLAMRKEIEDRVRERKKELEEFAEVWKPWKRRYGAKASLGSPKQLAHIFYDYFGFKAKKQTDSGSDATDYDALSSIDHPFIPLYLQMRQMQKSDTFLKGILEETVDGVLHPTFNLHIARSYRSSSDSPNFQNNPVRNKEQARMIRSVFMPRPNSVIAENDFKGIEVSVSACYHKDRNFIRYIEDKSTDMHRDMAKQIFKLSDEDWKELETQDKKNNTKHAKDIRHASKNKFVFPQFYGNYYVACARDLWEAMIKESFKGPGGIPLVEFLAKRGIKELGACEPGEKPKRGTFEKHIYEVEQDFWGRRFKEYEEWRRRTYKDYLGRGYFDILSGFRVRGDFNRKIVTNYPIQGAAFHCLLWSLIQINRKLRKYKFKSKIFGQIHDSLLADVKVKELRDYLEIVEEITTVKLREHYKWLVVPLEIEYEITPAAEAGGNWYNKRAVKFEKGYFYHPEHPEKRTEDARKFVNVLNRLAK